MDHAGVGVGLEGLEVGPLPASEELVLQVPEDLLGRPVVQAVALPRHALHHVRRPQAAHPLVVLALPAHVGAQHGPRARGHLREQAVEQLALLDEVGASETDQATISGSGEVSGTSIP